MLLNYIKSNRNFPLRKASLVPENKPFNFLDEKADGKTVIKTCDLCIVEFIFVLCLNQKLAERFLFTYLQQT